MRTPPAWQTPLKARSSDFNKSSASNRLSKVSRKMQYSRQSFSVAQQQTPSLFLMMKSAPPGYKPPILNQAAMKTAQDHQWWTSVWSSSFNDECSKHAIPQCEACTVRSRSSSTDTQSSPQFSFCLHNIPLGQCNQ